MIELYPAKKTSSGTALRLAEDDIDEVLGWRDHLHRLEVVGRHPLSRRRTMFLIFVGGVCQGRVFQRGGEVNCILNQLVNY